MITELDKLKRAKEYMIKLADGVDPIGGQQLPDDTVLNNERLSRCFAYVAEILQKVIDSGGKGLGWQRPFFITAEEIKRVRLSDQPVPISAFVQAVNEAVGDLGRKNLAHSTVTKWLADQGYLRVVQDADRKTHKELTGKSAEIGISSEERTGQSGTYAAILYDRRAQQFILDNLLSIVGAAEKKE